MLTTRQKDVNSSLNLDSALMDHVANLVIKSKTYYLNFFRESCSTISYTQLLNDFEKADKIDESFLKRPRLMTFENLVDSNGLIAKREKLFEDFKKLRLEMKTNNNNNEYDIMGTNTINLPINNNANLMKDKKRTRFMSM